jgi:rhodanese-related sulfurtransferase
MNRGIIDIKWEKIMGLKGVFLLFFVLLGSAAGAEDKSGDTRVLKDVTAEEALDLIKMNAENADFVVLDIRASFEFNDGHLENAVNIDFYYGAFKDELGKLDKNKTYLIYCAVGDRSRKSLKIMKKMGFTEVYNMLEGFEDWSSKGMPFIR